jgi:hypothetical protein
MAEAHVPADLPNDVLSLKPLEPVVQLEVVHRVIVAFREQELRLGKGART